MDGYEHDLRASRHDQATVVCGLDHVVIPWVCALVPAFTPTGNEVSLGVVRKDKLIAGVIYHDYQKDCETIQLTMAARSPRWVSVIAALLDYPFRQLNVWTVYTMTPEANIPALRVNEKIGFKEVARIPHGYGREKCAVIRQMTRKEFEERYGKKLT